MKQILKPGVGFFLRQRLSAVVLVPLLMWVLYVFIVFMMKPKADQFIRFFASPLNSSFLIILLFLVIYHGYLGVSDILRDYIKSDSLYNLITICLAIFSFLTCFISLINMFFYHILIRYLSGFN